MRTLYLTCLLLLGLGLTTVPTAAQSAGCPSGQTSCSSTMIVFDNGLSGFAAWLDVTLGHRSSRSDATTDAVGALLDRLGLRTPDRVSSKGSLIRYAAAAVAASEAIRAGRYTEIEVLREGQRHQLSFRRPESDRRSPIHD